MAEKTDILKRNKTIQSEVISSNNDPKRLFLVRRTWDVNLPKLLVISIRPAYSDLVVSDTTTSLCMQQAVTLGYGSVSLINLYSRVGLNDRNLSKEGPLKSDKTNVNVILETAETADKIVLATGRKNDVSIEGRKSELLELLKPYAEKLCEIMDKTGNRGYHPLSPRVRWNWELTPLSPDLSDSGRPAKR